jgi:uncharacterized repeat protein (TIGR03806 family)
MKKVVKQNFLKIITLLITTVFLSACGSDTEDLSDICSPKNTEINWEALLTANCQNLSDYNLFTDANNPTSNPRSPGIPYDLSTALFTDYATKYRYVFVPDGKSATYSEFEVMDFPVGTVLVKTFALPANTSDRDGAETIIETRLLINRSGGWTALPYYWESTSNASYVVAGKTVKDQKIIHDNVELTFDYLVPQKNQCTKCHTVNPMRQGSDDNRSNIFKPIGPKSRYLNHDYEYAESTQNQLLKWKTAGILTGAPDDLNNIDTASDFHDDVNISGLSTQELNLAARSYLDINCAHCHRSELTIPEANYEGPAGDSGLQMEFNRDFDTAPSKFGVCKQAVASGKTEYPRDIIPGHADKSYLPFRMNSLDGTHKMPELGRSTVHTEGVELINAWINDMTMDDCGLTL